VITENAWACFNCKVRVSNRDTTFRLKLLINKCLDTIDLTRQNDAPGERREDPIIIEVVDD